MKTTSHLRKSLHGRRSIRRKMLNIVYIAGESRSGSTLITRILGQIDGVLNVGELLQYVTRNEMRNRNIVCGCGENYDKCSFWREVVPGGELPNFSFQAPPLRLRNWYELRRLIGSDDSQVGRIVSGIEGLLQTISQNTESVTIVDSSKSPLVGLLLSASQNIEMHVLHLVRDIGGVVESMGRKKGYLSRHPRYETAASWIVNNSLASRLDGVCSSYQLIRYEDFVGAPRAVIEQILATIGITSDLGEIFVDRRVRLAENHAVAGNPDKLHSGWIDIKFAPPAKRNLAQIALRGLAWP